MWEFILANQTFILGMLATLIVWVVWKITGHSVDKTKILAILGIILDIIQDIKINPKTAELSDFEKKALAIQRVEALLPLKKKNLAQKVFGSIGGAVEYVYQNRKWMLGAATSLAKAVF